VRHRIQQERLALIDEPAPPDLNLYSSDQDYFFWAPALGEPFISDGVLHYFDGRTLTIVGYTFRPSVPEPIPENPFARVLDHWVSTEDVRIINYFGPTPLHLDPGYGVHYRIIDAEEPEPFNVDVEIALDSSEFLCTRRARKTIREVGRHDIVVTCRREPSMAWQHIELIRTLISRNALDVSGVAFLLNSQRLLGHPSVLVFEARASGRVVGFAVAHSYFNRHPFVVTLATEPGVHSAADALYVAMFKHYAAMGAIRLGLGYCVDEGAYSYKTKWGACTAGLPYYQLIWRRRDASERYVCFDWRVRALTSVLHGSTSSPRS
jgi:hypothetical protein